MLFYFVVFGFSQEVSQHFLSKTSMCVCVCLYTYLVNTSASLGDDWHTYRVLFNV